MDLILNPEQLEAVAAREGYWCCMAGPGSGKTRVITERYKELNALGGHILNLTFTRQAAQEMAKRAGLDEEQTVFRTFHSFCRELIYKESAHLGFELIACPPEQGKIVKLLGSLCRRFGAIKYKDLAQYISEQKRKGIAPEFARGRGSLVLAYQEYESACRNQGWLDYDSMIVETANLLERNAEVRARWQFDWVQVDEAQDTDAVQFKIIKLISEEHKNVFLVGDEEQLLYSWRGAVPDSLSSFTTLFPGGKFIYLFRNYRSTPEIVQFCKENAPKQSELISRLVSERESGVPPTIIRYDSDVHEAEFTISSIIEPEDTAILARTNRQLARFENICIERGIKYSLLGKAGFWTQPETRNVLALLQASIYPTDAAVATIIQCPYDCTRFLRKRDVLDAIKSNRKDGDERSYIEILSDSSAFKGFPENQQENIRRVQAFIRRLHASSVESASQTLKRVLDVSDVLTYYETEEESDGDNDAIENINEIYKISARFQNAKEFLDFARRAIAASRKSKQKRLTISTIHQSKGREFKEVFLVGVCEGMLPHKRGELAEERRIFFVGCSRAAERLWISYFGPPSSFLERYINDGQQQEAHRIQEERIVRVRPQATLGFENLSSVSEGD